MLHAECLDRLISYLSEDALATLCAASPGELVKLIEKEYKRRLEQQREAVRLAVERKLKEQKPEPQPKKEAVDVDSYLRELVERAWDKLKSPKP